MFVANPWTDFQLIYSQQYYEGRGAERLAEYTFELDNPETTVRKYEWQGILRLVRHLIQREDFRWLDYGCGNGGQVRFVRESSKVDIQGFEEGWIAARARERGIPLLDRSDLDGREGSFDVVTAIEVMEHVVDPIDTMRHIRKMLKPGGLFFYTTGNARKHQARITQWQYLIPEIHISLFEPSTLQEALQSCGFRTEYAGFLPGHGQVIQARTLKNLRVRTRATWQSLLSWEPVARLIDLHVGFTAHPIGWAE